MPSRVKQHQLEDISRSKYSLSLPRQWVMRDKDKDYGIDAEVEIFNDNGEATGLVYWVQLKATETKDKKAARKLDLKINVIQYYKSLELPVLIVKYSNEEDLFYCKWAHEVDLYYSKKNAKTIRIIFTASDIWNTTIAKSTITYLRKLQAVNSGAVKLPIPIHLNIVNDSVNEVSRGAFIARYRSAITEYSNLIKDEPNKDEPNKDECLISITLNNDDLIISLSSLTGCTFHGVTKANYKNIVDEVIAHTILGIGSSLVIIGQHEQAARILLDDKIKKHFVSNEALALKFLPILMSTSMYGELIDTVCDVMDTSDNNLLEGITTMSALVALDTSDNEKYKKFQELLNKCLEKTIAIGEDSLIGVSHYNLGNHYRNHGLSRKSIYHYLQAKRYEPKYLNQIYFYQELAGAFFECDKYRIASKLYKQALDMGENASIKPLYADALMFDGKYQLALDVFSEYINTSEASNSEWHLKHMCLNHLISMTGITEQVRRNKEAMKLVDVSLSDTPEFVEKLDEAIRLDNICGLVWFNMGITESKAGKNDAAAYSFILCGLVQSWDVEAWVNATLCCLNKEVEIQLLPLVVSSSYFFNGEDYLLKLYEQFEVRFNNDTLEKLTNIIEELLPKDRNKKIAPKVRLMNEEGIFTDVFTEKNT